MNRKTIAILLQHAQDAIGMAYAPYSNFKVGAAVLANNGKIYSGANIENASFGLSICAERVAVFKAITAGEKEIKAILVFTPTEVLTAPCGACLQVINEFSKNPIIILACPKKTKKFYLKQLLPSGFKFTKRTNRAAPDH
ncbi:MAG: cytidine deaminase [candidate division WOR-3 bacterium]